MSSYDIVDSETKVTVSSAFLCGNISIVSSQDAKHAKQPRQRSEIALDKKRLARSRNHDTTLFHLT